MTAHWIDNRPVAAGGARIAVINPATEEVIDTIPSGSAEAAAEAAAAARRAFPGWSALSPLDRRKAILPALDKLTALREDVARLLTQEMGKPLARTGGVIINGSSTWRTDQLAYGGLKDSGIGREGPHYAIREMTEERLLLFNL